LTDVLKKNEINGALGTYGERISANRVLMRRAEGKRPLGKPRCEWKDSLNVGLQEVG